MAKKRKSVHRIANDSAPLVREEEGPGGAVPPKMAIRFEFGRRFRKAMAEKGVRQIQVAEGTDIGRDSISGYARGRVLPEGDRLKKICDFLGTTPEKLIPHYGVDERTAELMPALEIKQAEQAGMVWVRINQIVSLEQVSRIMAILNAPPLAVR